MGHQRQLSRPALPAHPMVSASLVADTQARRSGRVMEPILEIKRGTVLINATGENIGPIPPGGRLVAGDSTLLKIPKGESALTRIAELESAIEEAVRPTTVITLIPSQ
jgi:hypothetical protein